jgi:DNA-binding CsgD family transcriptional regulator
MPKEVFNKLAANLRGSLITPESSEYDVARKVYNGMIDRRPAAIVRCADVVDVRTAMNFARQERLALAIRGGDHNGAMLEMAFLRRRFALMLATLGQPREAEEKRREAFELARRLGLRPFLDCLQSDTVRAASLLSEDASRPMAAISLTPRQRSILGLIAKGLTNKEIASHLNLSARTIEMHVALALERLNCRARSEGVSRAISQGLLGSKPSS